MPTYSCKNGHKSTINLAKCLACGESIFETFEISAAHSNTEPKGFKKTFVTQYNKKISITHLFGISLLVAVIILGSALVRFNNSNKSYAGGPSSNPSNTQPSTLASAVATEISPSPTEAFPLEKLVGPFEIVRVISADTYDVIGLSQKIKRIRLIGIDSPGENQDRTIQECGGTTAIQQANFIFSYQNLEVMLEPENLWPKLDELGNEFFYVWIGEELLSEKLLKSGDAVEYAKHGPYKHQPTHLAAQQSAQGISSSGSISGIWKECPSEDGITFGVGAEEESWDLPIVPFVVGSKEESFDCHPSYLGTCLNPNSGDYNCGSMPILVVGPDVYRLDGDNDGIACEN